jgi:hypothetical protein
MFSLATFYLPQKKREIENKNQGGIDKISHIYCWSSQEKNKDLLTMIFCIAFLTFQSNVYLLSLCTHLEGMVVSIHIIIILTIISVLQRVMSRPKKPRKSPGALRTEKWLCLQTLLHFASVLHVVLVQ